MTTSTFIFVHDQQIVLDYIAANKFSDLPDVKYCFLGMRPTEQIENLPNVIIARDLPDNIEHYPNLVAWTGWYALVRNNLVTTDIVTLFEYDVNVTDWWFETRQEAYFWHASADGTWWNYNFIEPELRKAKPRIGEGALPMTSNYKIKKETLADFVVYFMYLISVNNLDPHYKNAGHVIERICSAFMQDICYYGNGVQHLYADSHGTQGRGDRYEQLKSKLL
jgi:hypothetical protein